jgi:hypothetical protein
MSPSNFNFVLRERCGRVWTQKFYDKNLKIDETIPTPVPELLPPKTIKAIHQMQKAKSTYIRSGGRRKNEYLLSGHIFCAECGYAMSGQGDGHGHLYYRHSLRERRIRKCPLIDPRPSVRADAIEKEVIHKLFNLFGNPAQIERAVKDAIPDCDKLVKRQERLAKELSKIEGSRKRLIDLVVKDTITNEDAEPKLLELKERESSLGNELDSINAQLADIPDAERVKVYCEQVGDNPGEVWLYDEFGNNYAGGNDIQTFLIKREKGNGQDRRDLIEWVFGIPLPDGKPAGVYLKPAGGERYGPKQFTYELRGRWNVLEDRLFGEDGSDGPVAKGYMPYALSRKSVTQKLARRTQNRARAL